MEYPDGLNAKLKAIKAAVNPCPDCGAAMERVSEKQPIINFVAVPDVTVLKCPKCGKRVAV